MFLLSEANVKPEGATRTLIRENLLNLLRPSCFILAACIIPVHCYTRLTYVNVAENQMNTRVVNQPLLFEIIRTTFVD